MIDLLRFRFRCQVFNSVFFRCLIDDRSSTLKIITTHDVILMFNVASCPCCHAADPGITCLSMLDIGSYQSCPIRINAGLSIFLLSNARFSLDCTSQYWLEYYFNVVCVLPQFCQSSLSSPFISFIVYSMFQFYYRVVISPYWS